MSECNWPSTYRSDDPRYHDPQFQRRVVSVNRPIAFVENMHEVLLECGHAPLLFGDDVPAVDTKCFCPACYEARNKQRN